MSRRNQPTPPEFTGRGWARGGAAAGRGLGQPTVPVTRPPPPAPSPSPAPPRATVIGSPAPAHAASFASSSSAPPPAPVTAEVLNLLIEKLALQPAATAPPSPSPSPSSKAVQFHTWGSAAHSQESMANNDEATTMNFPPGEVPVANQSTQGQGTAYNPMADPFSPYFLHASESPGAVLVSSVLTPQNYHHWARAMRLALKGKNKLAFIDGTLPKPNEDDPLFLAWDRCNTFVVSWINQTLSSDIMQSVAWAETASTLWNDLKKRYSQTDVFRVADLHEEMFSIRQGDLSVTNYFTKLKALWEEIDNLQPIPNCSCGVSCSCGFGIIRGYRRDLFAVRFLKGLNEQYTNVKSQIMLMKPLPDVDEILSLLTQQERQLNVSVETNILLNTTAPQNFGSRSSTFNQHQAPRGRGQGRGRGGRVQPSNLGGRGTSGRRQSTKSCSFCGKIGHLVDSCYKKNSLPPHRTESSGAINHIQADDNLEEVSSISSISSIISNQQEVSASPNASFTPEQRKALIAILQQLELPSSSSNINEVLTTQSQPGSPNLEDDWCS